jgi:hypothetical protein
MEDLRRGIARTAQLAWRVQSVDTQPCGRASGMVGDQVRVRLHRGHELEGLNHLLLGVAARVRGERFGLVELALDLE